jgi:nucleoside diphosphate kinase
MTLSQAEEFYAEKKNEPYYQDLMQEMIRYIQNKENFEFTLQFSFSGPSLVLYLTKRDAVQGFRTLLGPAEKEQLKEATGT